MTFYHKAGEALECLSVSPITYSLSALLLKLKITVFIVILLVLTLLPLLICINHLLIYLTWFRYPLHCTRRLCTTRKEEKSIDVASKSVGALIKITGKALKTIQIMSVVWLTLMCISLFTSMPNHCFHLPGHLCDWSARKFSSC